MYALNLANLASKNLPVRRWNCFENGAADVFAAVPRRVLSSSRGLAWGGTAAAVLSSLLIKVESTLLDWTVASQFHGLAASEFSQSTIYQITGGLYQVWGDTKFIIGFEQKLTLTLN